MIAKQHQVNRLGRLKNGITSYVKHYNQSRRLRSEQKDEIKSRINHRIDQYQELFHRIYGKLDKQLGYLIIIK